MTRVRLHNHPNLPPRGEFERIARAERQMDGKFDSAVHAGDNDGVSLGKGEQLARQNVACAQTYRRGGRQQDVSGADADAQLAAGFGAD